MIEWFGHFCQQRPGVVILHPTLFDCILIEGVRVAHIYDINLLTHKFICIQKLRKSFSMITTHYYCIEILNFKSTVQVLSLLKFIRFNISYPLLNKIIHTKSELSHRGFSFIERKFSTRTNYG